MSGNLAADFWSTVGRRIDFDDLKVGEVFLLERGGGRVREVARCVGRDGDDVICVAAPGAELGDSYKVMILDPEGQR